MRVLRTFAAVTVPLAAVAALLLVSSPALAQVSVPTSAQFDALEQRVRALEALVPTPTPTPQPIPVPEPTPVPIPPPSQTYFDLLCSRPERFLCYGLRTQAELDRYKNASSQPSFVTYDATADAAKVTIPAIDPRFAYTSLATAIDATQTTIPLSVWHSEITVGRALKIDEEVLRISTISAATRTVTVTRARGGTTAAPHVAGRAIYIGNNNLLNQVRLPVNLAAGAQYLVTWDVRWDGSFLATGLTNHKAFQLSNSGDALMLEVQTRYTGLSAGQVAGITLRGYGSNPLDPIPPAASFAVASDVWTRFWLVVDATASPALVSLWMADATRDPVAVYTRVPRTLSLPAAKFWLEFNTSTNAFNRTNLRDLVAHVRNVVVLRNVADVAPFLVKP